MVWRLISVKNRLRAGRQKTFSGFIASCLICLLPGTGSAEANPPEFAQCTVRLADTARQRGVKENTLGTVIPGLRHIDRVIELDRRQPEFTSTFSEYFSRRVTDTRVERGRQMYRQHRELLKEITRQTGIPGHYLVAFWGLETNYGGYKGKMPVLDALATLACDKRRSKFFTEQFMAALQLMETNGFSQQQLQGSWAGALGHVQFMPSVYLKYARDADGDNRADLWNSIEDALFSAATFLKAIGWQSGSRWGREVVLPETFDFGKPGLEKPKALREWAALGIKDAHGRQLPALEMPARLLIPAGHEGPVFLVYRNFNVIMGWNRSEFYALSVGHLADRIAGAGKLLGKLPANDFRLSRDLVLTLQTRLTEQGYLQGKPDGIFGPVSRSALRAFQQARGLVPDGYVDREVLEQMQIN